jgi:hypothetical protein
MECDLGDSIERATTQSLLDEHIFFNLMWTAIFRAATYRYNCFEIILHLFILLTFLQNLKNESLKLSTNWKQTTLSFSKDIDRKNNRPLSSSPDPD